MTYDGILPTSIALNGRDEIGYKRLKDFESIIYISLSVSVHGTELSQLSPNAVRHARPS